MMRRLFVCSALLFVVSVVICPSVKAQCSPNPCYTANQPVVTRLTPAQAASRGQVTGTMTITVQGGVASHNATATAGSQITLNWTSNNAVSAQTTEYTPGGTIGPYPESLSGTYTWTTTAADIGKTYSWVYTPKDQNGDMTQDKVTLTTVSGTPGTIVSQDGLPENTILHFHSSGGGGSMLNDFTECQAGQIHQCINATHTPKTWLTVSNLSSGEVQSHAKHVSGNTASANQQVSFGDDMFLSALPEDVFEYTEGDEVDCSVFGPIGVAPVHMDIRFERAVTEEYISSIINSNGMHPEHIYCIIAATPPDFPGADEALPGTPSGQVVNIAFLYREWPAGTQENGTPWNLVFPDIQEVGLGYYVKTTMEPDPSGCTMWDNGFRHLPLPTPLDPQPQ